MAEGIPVGLSGNSAEKGRRFGYTVGGAFLVLGAVAAWRGKPSTAVVLATLGVVLLLGAVLVPARLLPIERAWMRMALAISKVTTPIFMGVVWFLIVTPTGFVRRMLGKSQISRDANAATFWVDRTDGQRKGNLERQF